MPGLVVPTQWIEGPLAYSPFPAEWPEAAVRGKAIVVNQPKQVFAAYELGHLVRWGPVSSGRLETATPAGQYHLTWRSRSRRSTDNDAWLLEWYFNFINSRGISFHLFDLPGYPGSHACVRLLERDAKWLYEWGDQWKLDATKRNVRVAGTLVVVDGNYNDKAPAPWTTVDGAEVEITLPRIR